MQGYSAILNEVKSLDVSLQYDLLQHLIRMFYKRATGQEAKRTEGSAARVETQQLEVQKAKSL